MVDERGHTDAGRSVKALLKTVRPFSASADEEIAGISRSVMEQFYHEGTLIFKQGKMMSTPCTLSRPGVRLRLYEDDEGGMLKEYSGPGDDFGALGIIMDTRANLSVEALEDTACILFPI